MSRLLITEYTFDPVNKRVSLPNIEEQIPGFQLGNIKIITNLNDGSVIYLPQSKSRYGIWNGSYIQLIFDTTEMTASDELQIIVSDSNLLDRQLRSVPLPVVGPLTNDQLRDTPVSVSVDPDPLSTVWNKLFTHYLFDHVNNKVKFPIWPLGYAPLSQDQIVQIVNVTRNKVIYSPAIPGLGGALTTVDGIKQLNLDLDTTTMDDSDILQIVMVIPPATHYARNKSVVMSSTIVDAGGSALQEFSVDPVIPVESQLDYSTPLYLDPQDRCLQVVKMSSDSIAHVMLTLYSQLIPGDQILIDDFNTYVDTDDLKQTWVPGHDQVGLQLETGDEPYEGSGAMSFIIKRQSIGYAASRTYTVDQDWSNRASIHFYHKSSIISSGVNFQLRLKDADSNWAYKDVNGAIATSWYQITLPLYEFTSEVNSIDFSKIREIQFVPTTFNAESREYLDLIEVKGWSEFDSEVELIVYDFGSSEPNVLDALPAPSVLKGGVTHRNYIVDFNPGVIRAHLHLSDVVRGNYYGIAVRNLSDYHQVIMLGSSYQRYMSGGTYLLDVDNIGERLDMSLAFAVSAPIACFYEDIEVVFNDDPGYAALLWITLVNPEGVIVHTIAGTELYGQRQLKFDCSNEDFNCWWEQGVQSIHGYFQSSDTTKATSFVLKSSIFHPKHETNG